MPDLSLESACWARGLETVAALSESLGTILQLDQLLAPTPTDEGLRVELRPELLNPAGILQGGVTALLAELAAQRTLEASTGRDLVVTSFDVRYVTMGRVGPFDAVVEPIGPETAVVKVVDRGADDAVVTHNLIGFAAV